MMARTSGRIVAYEYIGLLDSIPYSLGYAHQAHIAAVIITIRNMPDRDARHIQNVFNFIKIKSLSIPPQNFTFPQTNTHFVLFMDVHCTSNAFYANKENKLVQRSS